MRTTRLCGPLDVTAQRQNVARVGRDGPDESGFYSDRYACGCAFHGRFVASGTMAGHHYGSGSESLCDAHAIPEDDDGPIVVPKLGGD